MDSATLLCTCSDRRGIVATLTGFVFEHGGNIIDLDQHTDDETGRFYMRLVWDRREFAFSRENIPSALAMMEQKFPDMSWRVFFSSPLPRVAIFVSKTQHCLADLLLRHQMGEIPGEIALVVSNHPDLQDLSKHFSVPFHHIPITPTNRLQAEAEQITLLKDNQIDLLVLARYMQILTPSFTQEWKGGIINIHHSFLPAFIGARPYHQARQRGVKIIGATAHYVTEDLDQGPIIAQDVTPVSHRDNVEDLIRKGRDIERLVLGRAVRIHLEHRVIADTGRTIVF
ncbi:MAG: formyltetrahydrofolate deformylase [Planctomycetota bacterium]|jgi:formyltetrahydrofolate deformylase|nr:formyltetrahydrofolate deformylase [Planctomycetota bacterium]